MPSTETALLLPSPPRRATLRSFGLAVGTLTGALGALAGWWLDRWWWVAAGALAMAALAPVIALRPWWLHRPYLVWNRVARRCADVARTWLLRACYFTAFLATGRGPSGLGLEWPAGAGSLWRPRSGDAPPPFPAPGRDGPSPGLGARLRPLGGAVGQRLATRAAPVPGPPAGAGGAAGAGPSDRDLHAVLIATVLRFLRASFGAVVGLVLALPVLLVTAPLWLVAAATRRLTRLLEPPGEPWDALIEFEPVIGWKPTPNLRAVGRVEDVFRVSTDADGWRGDTSLAESDLVVFGDSFAWGQGVDDEAFFGNLGDGIAIKAIGSPGYNMVQELLWMERLAPSLAGKLVVWMVFIGNDLYDNLQPNLYRYRMPFVREAPEPGAWEIVTEHVSRVPWTATSKWAYHERLAEMCAPTFVAGRAYSAFAHLVARAAGVLEEAGADLAVLGIPDRAQLDPSRREWLAAMAPDPATFDPDLPDARMGSACADVGVPFVALKDHIRLDHYKLYDIHWNEAGHRRVAAVLEEVYEAAVAERARGAAAVSAEPRRERLPA